MVVGKSNGEWGRTGKEKQTNKQKIFKSRLKCLKSKRAIPATRHHIPRPQYTPHGSEVSGWLRAAIGKAARGEAVVNGHAVEAIQ